MNFAEALRRSSRLDPSGTALLHGERRVDYLALQMGSQRFATILSRRHGIAPGDRVAVVLPDTPEFAFVAYGILWAGGVLCAIPIDTDPGLLAEQLATATAKLLIGWHTLAEEIEQLSGQLDLDWLLVEPREFSRLLAATPPRAPLAEVGDDAPAILLEPGTPLELHHAGLALRAAEAADEIGLHSGMVVAAGSLSDPDDQIRTLHAAVSAGASLSLVTVPVRAATELSCR